jgi:thymidine kinase
VIPRMVAKVWFKPALWGLAAVLLAVVVGSVFLYIRNAETAKAQVIILTERLETAVEAARSNDMAFLQCQAVNHQNEKKAQQARLQAAQGVIRIAELELAASRNVRDINDEAETFRTDLGCPALTGDFRKWLQDD